MVNRGSPAWRGFAAAEARRRAKGRGGGKGRKIGLGSFLEFYDRDNIEYSGRGFPGSKESVEL